MYIENYEKKLNWYILPLLSFGGIMLPVTGAVHLMTQLLFYVADVIRNYKTVTILIRLNLSTTQINILLHS